MKDLLTANNYSMSNYIQSNGLRIAKPLYELVGKSILPDLAINSEDFWQKLATIAEELIPENRALLAHRDNLQNLIDGYHHSHPGTKLDLEHYKKFLHEISYLEPEVDDFTISVSNVDDEIARIAGPQLVVPMSNARFTLNAANARWGSLYDALYGTDAIEESDSLARSSELNPERARLAIEWANSFLDTAIPLTDAKT